jgi:hypothetical protein
MAMEPGLFVHELGHNLGLQHAGKRNGDEYSDTSDVMGACCLLEPTCLNAVHEDQLQLRPSIAVLNTSSTTWQQQRPYLLGSDREYMVIKGKVFWFYVQFRMRPEASLLAPWERGPAVLVYATVPWTPNEAVKPTTTLLTTMTGASPNTSWIDVERAITVAVTFPTPSSALVSVTRHLYDTQNKNNT